MLHPCYSLLSRRCVAYVRKHDRHPWNRKYIVTPPEEDRTTDTGNVQAKSCEYRTCNSGDTVVDRQTRRPTDRQTDAVITILRSFIGGGATTSDGARRSSDSETFERGLR